VIVYRPKIDDIQQFVYAHTHTFIMCTDNTIILPRYDFLFGVTNVSVTPSGNILRTRSVAAAAAVVQSKRVRAHILLLRA